MFSSKCATHGSRFTSDSSGGGSWFRSRHAEAMDWRADDERSTEELEGQGGV